MLGKVKVLLSVIISYIISSDESVEAVNVSASRRLLLDMDENVTQENEPFPNANGLLYSIPEHEANGQKDTDNNLEGIEDLLENDLLNNILLIFISIFKFLPRLEQAVRRQVLPCLTTNH